MLALKLDDIAKAVGGRLINYTENIDISGISINSKDTKPGQIYMCISLIKNHTYLEQIIEIAQKLGASALIVPKETNSPLPQIIFNDANLALSNLTRYYRSKFTIPVVAITGTCGKSSTKEMLDSVLREKYNVLKTSENNNNIIGVIYTVLGLKDIHEACVLEIGLIHKYGDIEISTNAAQPTIAVITNVGTGHFQNFGSKEHVLKAKMEITSYFNEKNTLIINGDDELLSTIKDKPYRIIKTSIVGNGDYNANEIIDLGEKGVTFKCCFRGEDHLFKLSVPGRHNVYNALAVIAIGDILNVDADKIKRGLLKFRTLYYRMNIIKYHNNIKILLDCYNANLESMKSGIDTLVSFNGNRKIAVIGDILELGNFSEDIHRQVGKYLKDKCDIVLAVGNNTKYVYEETKDYIESYYFNKKNQACEYLKQILKPDDVVLIKGSRGMGMEHIYNALK